MKFNFLGFKFESKNFNLFIKSKSNCSALLRNFEFKSIEITLLKLNLNAKYLDRWPWPVIL